MRRLSLFLLLPFFQAHAQDSVQTLDRVVVTATRTERAQLDVPASIDIVDRDEVRDTHLRVNLSESLVRVPGLVILNRQNYAQDLQISVRGFGARSTFGVRGVRMYVDGIPATMPDGQGQVSHFALNAVDRIEVLRGPFSALYGNSSGGVIAMTTRLESGVNAGPNEFELSGAGGSYDTWRAGDQRPRRHRSLRLCTRCKPLLYRRLSRLQQRATRMSSICARRHSILRSGACV